MDKGCENCGYNDGYPCGKWEGCFPYDGAKNWVPDYQTLESQLEQYKEALRLAVELVIYWQKFTNDGKHEDFESILIYLIDKAKGE